MTTKLELSGNIFFENFFRASKYVFSQWPGPYPPPPPPHLMAGPLKKIDFFAACPTSYSFTSKQDTKRNIYRDIKVHNTVLFT